MNKYTLNSLNPVDFIWMSEKRDSAISSADGKNVNLENEANQLASRLHPQTQDMVVTAVVDLTDDSKCYTLEPNTEMGCTECAYFAAGQFVSVTVKVNGKIYSRPYSICSSPKEALQGKYQIAVKAVENGTVSHYILENWEIGTAVRISAPLGNFVYEPLRDASTIVGIAGGSGITPLLSLAKAITEGTEPCSLFLFYGCRNKSEILFKGELDELQRQSDKIQVIYVLSEEMANDYEQGFITFELISKYLYDTKNVSYFICGPSQLYDSVETELSEHNVQSKNIRCETHRNLKAVVQNKKVSVIVKDSSGNKTVYGYTSQTILEILENAGIAPRAQCRSGECGFCRSRLISGEIYTDTERDARRRTDRKHSVIHPCCSYPMDDIEIELLR